MKRVLIWIQGIFSRSPAIERILRNASWLMADRVLRLGINVFVAAWMARSLGPSDLGLLSFCLSLVWMLGIFSVIGLDTITVRELVRRQDAVEQILSNAFFLRLLTAAVATPLCIVCIIVLRPDDKSALQVVAILAWMVLPQVFDVVDYHYQAMLNARPVVLARNMVTMLFAIVRCWALLLGYGVEVLAWTFLGEAIVMGGSLALLGKRAHLTFSWRDISVKECQRLLRESWPLAVAGISVATYMKIDQIMLATLSSNAETGLFAAAVRISEAWYFVPTALMISVGPVLVAKRQVSILDYESQLERVGRSLLRFALLTSMLIALASPIIIKLLYGEQYAAAGPVLAVHAWAGIFVCFGMLGSNWLVNSGLTRFSMYQTIGGAVTNVGLNSILIPHYGAMGAAVATLVACSFSGLILHALAAPTRPVFFLQLRSLR